jgi:hypothetical protein
LNNEEIKATYNLPRTDDTLNHNCSVQDVEEKCRFHMLSETVLLRQIWDCLVHDVEEMYRFYLLSETVLLRQIWDCLSSPTVQGDEERCRYYLLSKQFCYGRSVTAFLVQQSR